MATAKNGHSPLNSLGHAAGGILSLPVRCAGLVGAILFTTLLTACGGGGGGARPRTRARGPAGCPERPAERRRSWEPGHRDGQRPFARDFSERRRDRRNDDAGVRQPLTFVVPAASARSGPITLAGTGFSVQALASFRVYGVPIVTNVSAFNAPLSQSRPDRTGSRSRKRLHGG